MSYSPKFGYSPAPYNKLSMVSDRLWLLPVRPRNIYVAASLNEQTAAMRFALLLMDSGFTVTSSWLRKDFSDKPSRENWSKFVEYEQKWGETDLADLERSDTLVVLGDEPSSSGGYWVELGYFFGAKRENIVFVGERRNVFAFTKTVRYSLTTNELIEWLLDSRHGQVGQPASPKILAAEVIDAGCMSARELAEVQLFQTTPTREQYKDDEETPF